jgi:hypothetical protein
MDLVTYLAFILALAGLVACAGYIWERHEDAEFRKRYSITDEEWKHRKDGEP